MTAQQALVLAQKALQKHTDEALRKWKLYGGGMLKTPEEKMRYEKQYMERAEALAIINGLLLELAGKDQ